MGSVRELLFPSLRYTAGITMPFLLGSFLLIVATSASYSAATRHPRKDCSRAAVCAFEGYVEDRSDKELGHRNVGSLGPLNLSDDDSKTISEHFHRAMQSGAPAVSVHPDRYKSHNS